MDARALFGLSAEACRGQMVRGGRSWPPEKKAAAGADSAGNMNEEVRSRLATAEGGGAMTVAQPPLAQNWQVLACVSLVDEPLSEAWLLAWSCVSACSCWPWSACMP